MRIKSLLLILFIGAITFTSCEKKYFKPPVVDPNLPVSFTKDIQPIFTANCTASGCHSGNVAPNLIPEKAYGSLSDGAYTDTLNPAQSVLMIKLNSNMPPTKLPASQINQVLTWIKQGAKQN